MNFFGLKNIIKDTSIKLLFGNTSDYLDCFKNIHQNFNFDDFIEVKDIDINDFTNNFLKENNIILTNVKQDKSILRKYIKEAKKETNITLTGLANYLGLSRNIIEYQYRKS